MNIRSFLKIIGLTLTAGMIPVDILPVKAAPLPRDTYESDKIRELADLAARQLRVATRGQKTYDKYFAFVAGIPLNVEAFNDALCRRGFDPQNSIEILCNWDMTKPYKYLLRGRITKPFRPVTMFVGRRSGCV